MININESMRPDHVKRLREIQADAATIAAFYGVSYIVIDARADQVPGRISVHVNNMGTNIESTPWYADDIHYVVWGE